MKKLSIILILMMVVFVACKKNEDTNSEFVNKSAETKTALLEEFTGVKCGYCPEGAIVAAEMIAAHPGKAIAIGIHGVSYNTPYGSDQDLTTTWANDLVSFAQNTGWPGGMINRRDHDNSGKLSKSRSLWKGFANTVISEAAPVNIGIKTTYEGGTAKITVQLYYTADGGGANLLNVAITENGIKTKQSGATEDPYTHKHVLRDLVTGQWGKTVSTTSTGTLETYEFTYKPKGLEVAANCEVVAFVTKADHTDVLNADMTHLVNGEKN